MRPQHIRSETWDSDIRYNDFASPRVAPLETEPGPGLPQAAPVSDYTAILSGTSWWGSYTVTPGKGTFLTYSFENVIPAGYSTGYTSNSAFYATFQAYPETAKAAVRAALDAWASVSGITFFEVPSGQGDMAFLSFDLQSDKATSGYAGFAQYPRVAITASYGWNYRSFLTIDDGYVSNTHVLLHEIGHSLGFEHSFEGDTPLPTNLDNYGQTVMSYTSGGFPGDVLGPLDIQAVRALYGDQSKDGTQVASWAWNGQTFVLTQTGFETADVIRGVASGNLIYGQGGDDLIIGGIGTDRIEGGDGADSLLGYAGDDTLSGGAGIDQLYGGDGNDTVSGGTEADTVFGGAGNDILNGDADNDRLYGEDGNDTLDGGDGNDNLYTGRGSDSAFGGAGNDFIQIEGTLNSVDGGDGSDVLAFWFGNGATQGVNFQFSTVAAMVRNIENIIMWGTDFGDTIEGSGLADQISAYNGNDVLNGAAGNDLLFGGEGNDTLYGGADNDQLQGEAGADTLDGGDGADTLFGQDGADLIIGGAGNDNLQGGNDNDILQGGVGSDNMWGGAGFDIASYEGASAAVSVFYGGGGTNTGEAAGDYLSEFEGLRGSAFNDTLNVALAAYDTATGTGWTLQGLAGDDVLTGGAGNDTFDGGAGADRFIGGNGLDVVTYASALAGLTASLATPSLNTRDAAGDTYAGIENLSGSAFSDLLVGDGGANRLSGQAGDDWLQGGAGADALDGGAGTDTADYLGATAGVTVFLGGAFLNTGEATGDSYTSIENIRGTDFADILGGDLGQNLINGGAGNDWLFGSDGADTLIGDAGNDVLSGGAGADALDGGDGIDVAYYREAAAGVTVDMLNRAVNTGEAAGDGWSNVENLWGSKFNDTLYGDDNGGQVYGFEGNDILWGRGGDDYFYGGEGQDTLNGGAGIDNFFFLQFRDNVNVWGTPEPAEGGDTITDFGSTWDRIIVSRYWFGFGNIQGEARGLTSQYADFITNGTLNATSTKPTFFWNATNGQLYFDGDGTGSDLSPVLLVTLTNGASLQLSDIWTA